MAESENSGGLWFTNRVVASSSGFSLSDLFAVFKIDDNFTIWLAISEII
jgi:hypothetical protein